MKNKIYVLVDKEKNIVKTGDTLLSFEKKSEAVSYKNYNPIIVPRGSKIKKAFIVLEEDTKTELKNTVTTDSLRSLGH